MGEMEAESPYDVFEERKWMFFIVGFAPVRNVGYFAYVIGLLALLVSMWTMAVSAVLMLSAWKRLLFDALHVALASSFAIWGLASRFLAKRSLLEILKKSKTGIYKYSEEELDEEQIKMNKAVPVQIKRKSNIILFVYTVGIISNTVFFPISQIFMFDDASDMYPDFLNPYLPHVFYSPFDTKTTLGYITVYMINFLWIFIAYVIAALLNTIFITTTEMMKGQFQVLNHSIKKIQHRAYLLYTKNNNVEPGTTSVADLLKSTKFQDYLFWCLKANIKHHQALLRFREDCRLFIGSVLLDVFVLAAIIYASILYQMYQTIPINVIVNYSCTSLAEQTYTYFICMFGQDMIEESNKIFLNLYSTNWFHYDDKFKQILDIMMVNSKKPVNFKALVLDIPASMETYGDSLSGMYKIMSLVRQSDVLQ